MTVELPEFPMMRTTPFDPPAEYAELERNGPVTRAILHTDQPVWLITGHESVRKILVDPRVSSDRSHPNFPAPVKVSDEARRRQVSFGRALIGADPPQHTEQRRMLIHEFTVRRVQALKPRIQEIVDERIDAMLAAEKPVDLFAELALPVPSMVICELLGVPYSDRDFFQSRTKILLSRNTAPERRQQLADELNEYFDELVTAKEADPGDDLLGRLIVRNNETEVFSHELLTALASLLLLAGHETTSNVISLGTLALLQHPDQLDAIKADPSLIPNAVEELLRYLTIVEAGFRVALEDIDMDGTVIRAGDALIALAMTANRDGSTFEQADEFDIKRGARHHVAFGYGVHQCLGQNLARTELETVFGTLFRRIPGLRLAVDIDDVPLKKDTFIYGVHGLPVTW